jgi:hypothetical protein
LKYWERDDILRKVKKCDKIRDWDCITWVIWMCKTHFKGTNIFELEII